jgi:HD-GYP domain-containing protein (c-di-GMP phosphodiesterase class II)
MEKGMNQMPLISQRGTELILKLYNAMRSVTTAQHDVSTLRKTVEGLLANGENLSIEVGRDRLFLNGQRIEMRCGHTVNRLLLNEFKTRGIGRIEFAGPPANRDLAEFLISLTETTGDGRYHGERLQKVLTEKDVESVRVVGVRPDAREEEFGLLKERGAYCARIYFYAMELMKEMYGRAEREDPLDLDLSGRVIQRIISNYANSPTTFMALATTKTNRGFLANHSVNVAIYALALGYRLGLPNQFLADLGLAALFHDIGESRLAWLREGGKRGLTDEEWEAVKLHPALGVKIVMGISDVEETTRSRLMEGIFTHHLKYDLSGFPMVKSRREVSLVSRIISLADFYDLATRPYGGDRFPYFSDRIPELILDRSETDFDPILARFFVRTLGVLPVGTLCGLDTGELAIVCGLAEEGTTGERPWVRLLIPGGRTYRGGPLVSLDSVEQETGRYERNIREIVNPNSLEIDVAEYLVEF